ncbi:MAG: FKBP-type peptidyl-prolyl cis-trans isomerase [Ginsengibacter sp.]
MKRSFYLMAAIVLFAGGCADNSPYKKAPDGSEYKIIANEKGKKAVAGNFLQLNILAKYKDSVLFSSIENSTPRFIPFDTAQLPVFFRDLHEGDSLILRVSTDTLIKHGQSAPFMKKNEYIYQYFKIVKLFPTREQVETEAKTYEAAAKSKMYKKAVDQINKELEKNAAQQKTDEQIITSYMAKNNIKANKTPWGTYVSIITPGTGNNLTDKDVAVVNYTGKTLKDSVFDSNTDKKFGHSQPYEVDMGEFGVIPGWIDGLKLMNKGSKGIIIIPSTIAYGKNGSPPKIGPNEVLVFNIEVADFITQDQYAAKQMEKRNQMQQLQNMQRQMQQQQKQQPQGQPK